jgi:hypothetical protein
MKELIIQVRVEGNNIATAITKNGFDDSASSALEIIGILQNVVSNEQEKLKTVSVVNIPRPNEDKKDDDKGYTVFKI